MVADLAVSFVTVNVMRHDSTFVVLFGEGFDLAGSVIDRSQIPGKTSVSAIATTSGQRQLTIKWENSTDIESGTYIKFVMHDAGVRLHGELRNGCRAVSPARMQLQC